MGTYLGKRSWPSPSPENYCLLPNAHHALLAFAPDCLELKRVWVSLLLPPGSVTIWGADMLGTKCYWVLSSTAHGALAWHADIRYIGGKSGVEIAMQETCWEILHVTDPAEWYILDCVGAPPARAHAEMQPGAGSHMSAMGFMLEAAVENPQICLAHCKGRVLLQVHCPTAVGPGG